MGGEYTCPCHGAFDHDLAKRTNEYTHPATWKPPCKPAPMSDKTSTAPLDLPFAAHCMRSMHLLLLSVRLLLLSGRLWRQQNSASYSSVYPRFMIDGLHLLRLCRRPCRMEGSGTYMFRNGTRYNKAEPRHSVEDSTTGCSEDREHMPDSVLFSPSAALWQVCW